MSHQNHVCPVELASGLDNRFRRWLQNPRKILAPFVRDGMRVLDIGCGPGYFSIELASLVGGNGRVIAADLQDGMLQRLADKIKGTEYEHRIRLVRCDQEKINVTDTVDFILAFYMVHEVPDQEALLSQLRSVLKKDGQVLLVEPKLFHVTRSEFDRTIAIATRCGFTVSEGPKLRVSWSALLRNS